MFDGDTLFDDLLGSGVESLETDNKPSPRALRTVAKRQMLRMEQQHALSEVLKELPKPGEQVHIVSAAKYDFWTWVPVLINWMGKTDHLYCSTWTLSRPNAVDLFTLWDAGKIEPKAVSFLTGTYFKRRETAVYAFLVDGLRSRGGRYRAFANHAKVLLLAKAKQNCWLTIEGSANLTANPRLEQYVITNDHELHDFHAKWMEEMLRAAPSRELF